MRTILVPVDATPASENAANVAIEWAEQYGYDHIILLKTSYESMFDYINIGDGYALVSEESINRQQNDAQALLERLSKKIIEKTSTIKVTTAISELPLLRCTIELIKGNASVQLVVLGSDHTVVANDSFVSANLISITRASPVKVLIVPNNYGYESIKNILIPCDIGNLINLDKLSKFKPRLELENIRLMLLNVDTKVNSAITDIKKKEWEESIHQYLTGVPYDIYYSFDKNIINGVISFTSLHKVDLIIALPGKHSFLYYLANKSISEGIYQNAHQAVLILK